jgi:DNA (cytosine-5)-methyltransferase 1
MLKVLELFGGIGACTIALRNLGINYKIVDYVEIDKYAVKSFNAIHNTNFEPQDITKWDKDLEVDLIMHGSPCQDFSLAGKQAGGDKNSGTRSSLMYETIRIVNKLKPKYIIWENVKNLLSKKHKHNFDAYLETLEQLGYNNYYQVLNAKDYGIPQNRERVFTISIRKDVDKDSFCFPKKQELQLNLSDLLEKKVDEKYYLSDEIINKISYDKSKDESLHIKNNTKKGYLKANSGDGCYISNIDKKRGTVQKNMIPTIKTSLDIGVVVSNEFKPTSDNKIS